jgi:BirA family biotin operon repressor/biotin-[acetyl-CoA-carboxylase] ligase
MAAPAPAPTPASLPAATTPASLAALQADFARAAEALWPVLHARLPGLSLEVLPTADSTNTRLLQRARAGEASPTALVAIEQTAGRGRQGRSWHARPGDALTFSLAVPWQPDAGDVPTLDGLSVAVGVALAEALHADVQVKWPNDLWLRDAAGAFGKLGGVLIEVAPVAVPDAARTGAAAARLVVIGVGVNVRGAPPAAAEPPARSAAHGADAAAAGPHAMPHAMPHASLAACSPAGGASASDAPLAPEHPAAVWQRVLPALVDAWLLFRHAGFAPFAPRFAPRDALAGCDVTLWPADGRTLSAQARGVDGSGRLLVHTAAGPIAWSAGDVSVRPQPLPPCCA